MKTIAEGLPLEVATESELPLRRKSWHVVIAPGLGYMCRDIYL